MIARSIYDPQGLDECADVLITRHGRLAVEAARSFALAEYEDGDDQVAAYWAMVAEKAQDMLRMMC